jgi:hypothetical protein
MKECGSYLYKIGGSWFMKMPMDFVKDSAFPEKGIADITKNEYVKYKTPVKMTINDNGTITLEFIKQ